MATPELPVGYFAEGKAYLEAVQKLGLSPNAFFWAFDQVTNGFVLVLISEVFDAVGPFELSKLLFKAYNADATPRGIDPFIIRLHSPDHQVVREMDKLMPLKVAAHGAAEFNGGSEIGQGAPHVTNVGGLDIDGDWIYVYDAPLERTHSFTEVLRHYHRFEKVVNQMAA